MRSHYEQETLILLSCGQVEVQIMEKDIMIYKEGKTTTNKEGKQ